MNLPDIPLFAMLRERMSWLNQRQGVLSQNVANADTPGYGARDLKAPDFETLLRNTVKGTEISSGLRTTNSKRAASPITQPPMSKPRSTAIPSRWKAK
jgi:flagellar basal-body rod protein FlgB